jgi:hypothetical protein
MTASAFETELAAQLRAAADTVAAAELAGDEVLAEAMRTRLDDLAAIALRHSGAA